MCEYFSLWDAEDETTSEWADELSEAHQGQVQLGDKSHAEIFEREGINEESLTWKDEQKLFAAEEYREKEALPVTCPHEKVSGEQYCMFHLSPETRREQGISRQDVTDELLRRIKEPTGNENDHKKCFAGGKFEEISLTYSSLTSDSHNPVQFHFARIRNLDLSHAVIDERLVLNGSEIEALSCESTRFRRPLSLEQATIDCSSVSFDQATFDDRLILRSAEIATKEVNFNECSFQKRVDFTGLEVTFRVSKDDDIDVRVQFNDSVFHDEVLHTKVTFSTDSDARLTRLYAEFKNCRFTSHSDFSDCTFQSVQDDDTTDASLYGMMEKDQETEGEPEDEGAGGDSDISWYVDFGKSQFNSGLQLRNTTVVGDLRLEEVSITSSDLNCTEAEITGDIDCEKVSVAEGGAFFTEIEIEGDGIFDQSSFLGKELDFSGSDIRCSLDMKKASCTVGSGKISFRDCHVGGKARFRQASFAGNPIEFNRAEMATTAEFSKDWDCAVDFCEMTWEGGRIDFSDAHMGGDTRFDLSKFSGDRAVFEEVDVETHLAYPEAEFSLRNVRFVDVSVGSAHVDFSNAVVSRGKFSIGQNNTVYNFEEALIGDVQLSSERPDDEFEGRSIFEHFIFKKTEFDGFDFNQDNIKRGLKDSNWHIHTSYGDSKERPGRIRRYYRLVKGENPDNYNPDELETTYMKAKLGAKENGDPNVVSKFFQKELQYRRHGYAQQYWDRNMSGTVFEKAKKRARITRDWIANTTLWITAGYGEKPSNLFISSVVIVLLFAFIYRGINALPPGTSRIDYITYSFQGFIQLVVGIKPIGGTLVSLFTAIEGFIGAFFIALFVITLTRSIDR